MALHASTRQRFLAAAFLALLTAACSGGGGGDGLSASPPTAAPSPAPAPAPTPQAVNWGTFPSAIRVIGQENFDDGGVAAPPKALNFPSGSPVVTSNGLLFVVDEQGVVGQVNAFRDYLASDGPDAAFSFTVKGGDPVRVSSQGQRFVVVEDHQVHIYNETPDAPPTADPNHTAGGAQGCSEMLMNAPRSAYVTPQGQLIVADRDNNRVLIWDAPAAEGPMGAAAVVIGQQDKDTCTTNAPSRQTLRDPASVWSDGARLIVVDRGNHRVLIWKNIPTQDFQAADFVIGQAGPTDDLPNAGSPTPTASTLFDPSAVDVSETGQMAITDRQNHRILVWNTIPTADNQAADQVIGQPDSLTGALHPTSGQTFNNPAGIRFDGRNLVVVDSGNNRVLVFKAVD